MNENKTDRCFFQNRHRRWDEQCFNPSSVCHQELILVQSAVIDPYSSFNPKIYTGNVTNYRLAYRECHEAEVRGRVKHSRAVGGVLTPQLTSSTMMGTSVYFMWLLCTHAHPHPHTHRSVHRGGKKQLNYWVMVINLQIVCRMLNRVPTLGSVQQSIIRLFALLYCFWNMITVREGWRFKSFLKNSNDESGCNYQKKTCYLSVF